MIPIQQRLKDPNAPIDNAIYQAIRELRVSLPGIVQSFDSGAQWGFPSVSVQLAIREIILQNAVPTLMEIPILDAVPVCVPQGGDWIDTFPITAGDECWVVFGDMAIDLWKQSGGVQREPDGFKFRHDIGDGVAIMGTRSAARPVANWSTTGRQIRNLDQSVMLDLQPSAATLQAPLVKVMAEGGTPAPVMTQDFLTWFTTQVFPWMLTHGYTWTVIPLTSATTVLEAE
jgi:hypothetical protein